jgi:hypothetical protein
MFQVSETALSVAPHPPNDARCTSMHSVGAEIDIADGIFSWICPRSKISCADGHLRIDAVANSSFRVQSSGATAEMRISYYEHKTIVGSADSLGRISNRGQLSAKKKKTRSGLLLGSLRTGSTFLAEILLAFAPNVTHGISLDAYIHVCSILRPQSQGPKSQRAAQRMPKHRPSVTYQSPPSSPLHSEFRSRTRPPPCMMASLVPKYRWRLLLDPRSLALPLTTTRICLLAIPGAAYRSLPCIHT